MAVEPTGQTVTAQAEVQMKGYPAPGILLYAVAALAFLASSPPCYSLGTNQSIAGNQIDHTRYAYCEPRQKAKDGIVLQVTDTTFSCDESSCERHYDSCTLAIDYTVSAESLAGATVETSVSCKAKILYRTEHGCVLSSETQSESISHDLRAHARDHATIKLGFQFSPYEAVVETSLHSVECLIRKEDSSFQHVSLSDFQHGH